MPELQQEVVFIGGGGKGVDQDPPLLRTTFDDEGGRDPYETIVVTGINQFQLLGGFTLDVIEYTHDPSDMPRDIFKPCMVGVIALQLTDYFEAIKGESQN
jgi:hypothetical protein